MYCWMAKMERGPGLYPPVAVSLPAFFPLRVCPYIFITNTLCRINSRSGCCTRKQRVLKRGVSSISKLTSLTGVSKLEVVFDAYVPRSLVVQACPMALLCVLISDICNQIYSTYLNLVPSFIHFSGVFFPLIGSNLRACQLQ